MAKSNNNMKQPQLTPEQQEMWINALKNATDITCSCGNNLFLPVVKFKKLSRLVLGTPDDVTMDFPSAICTKCQKELTGEQEPPKENKEGEIILDFKR